jgi:hypothetical protein
MLYRHCTVLKSATFRLLDGLRRKAIRAGKVRCRATFWTGILSNQANISTIKKCSSSKSLM